MNDKSWMLNPQAIRHAKTCIQIIKDRLNLKLKLSQTDFFHQLEDCAQQVRSFELTAAYHQLMAMAEANGVEVINNGTNVVPLFDRNSKRVPKAVDSIETVAMAGKHYPKWQAGKAFRGIYRGQPSYQ